MHLKIPWLFSLCGQVRGVFARPINAAKLRVLWIFLRRVGARGISVDSHYRYPVCFQLMQVYFAKLKDEAQLGHAQIIEQPKHDCWNYVAIEDRAVVWGQHTQARRIFDVECPFAACYQCYVKFTAQDGFAARSRMPLNFFWLWVLAATMD